MLTSGGTVPGHVTLLAALEAALLFLSSRRVIVVTPTGHDESFLYLLYKEI